MDHHRENLVLISSTPDNTPSSIVDTTTGHVVLKYIVFNKIIVARRLPDTLCLRRPLTMKTTLFIGVSLCLIVGWPHGATSDSASDRFAPPAAGASQSSKESSDSAGVVTADSLGPMGVFADIEDGWKKEKVQQILRHYGKGKVAISIEGSGPTGGTFSKNQSHYLFQDLFKYTIPTKFGFVQYRNASDDETRVYAVAERTYKRNDDGRLFADKIYVSLQLEDDAWVISEIKSVR